MKNRKANDSVNSAKIIEPGAAESLVIFSLGVCRTLFTNTYSKAPEVITNPKITNAIACNLSEDLNVYKRAEAVSISPSGKITRVFVNSCRFIRQAYHNWFGLVPALSSPRLHK